MDLRHDLERLAEDLGAYDQARGQQIEDILHYLVDQGHPRGHHRFLTYQFLTYHQLSVQSCWSYLRSKGQLYSLIGIHIL